MEKLKACWEFLKELGAEIRHDMITITEAVFEGLDIMLGQYEEATGRMWTENNDIWPTWFELKMIGGGIATGTIMLTVSMCVWRAALA